MRLMLLALLLMISPAWAGSDIGVIILHGTQGMPGSVVTARFEAAIKSAGYRIRMPEMCWSRNRIYDHTYTECLHDIDLAAAALQSAGAERIVVAGQGEGGNAALTYGAFHPDIAGVIALAPAGNPLVLVRIPEVQQSVTKAEQMVAGGHGNDRATFSSSNDGNLFSVPTTASIFLSFTDPNGPAVFTRYLPKITVPVLWVAGDADMSQVRANEEYARLPTNGLNRMVHFYGEHLDTPDAAIEPALKWLKSLGNPPP
jgi:pimeloyl-ACP methyl ester carboxylesterase